MDSRSSVHRVRAAPPCATAHACFRAPTRARRARRRKAWSRARPIPQHPARPVKRALSTNTGWGSSSARASRRGPRGSCPPARVGNPRWLPITRTWQLPIQLRAEGRGERAGRPSALTAPPDRFGSGRTRQSRREGVGLPLPAMTPSRRPETTDGFSSRGASFRQPRCLRSGGAATMQVTGLR
jgi:hypothetical protein